MAFRQIVEAPSQFIQELTQLVPWLSKFWRTLGQVEEWVTPTFQNSWANVGGAYETAGFYKDPFGRVHFKGAINTGVAGTTAFTLPEKYRPSATLRLAAFTGGSHYIEITSAGLVQPQAPAVYLDGISFRSEQ